MISFAAKDLDHGAMYRLLSGVIVPRPIAFVSTVSLAGVRNLAPFSFFMVGGSNPGSLIFSPTASPKGDKDTLRNVRDTGEFVVNLVHLDMAEGMNQTSRPLGPDESEWELTPFTQVDSVQVTPPRVAESFVQIECKLFQIVPHGEGPGAAQYVIGEVLQIHLHDHLAPEGTLVPEEFAPISRLGGDRYMDLFNGQEFRLGRP